MTHLSWFLSFFAFHIPERGYDLGHGARLAGHHRSGRSASGPSSAATTA